MSALTRVLDAMEENPYLQLDILDKIAERDCKTNNLISYDQFQEDICSKKTDLTWVKIEGGSFKMGGDGEYDGKPIHNVTLKSFMISESEVTVAQYRRCVNAKVCSAPRSKTDSAYCNWGHSNREDHPINCVSWFQLNTFAKWVGGRLPTEAEWEYAARSQGKEKTYPWGNQKPSCMYAVMNDGGRGCGENRTLSVCSKRRGNTEQGLCDMGGSVWEWVLDEYEESYNGAPVDGGARCKSSNCSTNTSDTNRVLRGGGWHYNGTRGFRTTFRAYYNPTDQNSYRGGRVAKSER